MQINRGTAAMLAWVINDKLWIIIACSFLEGDATNWATSIVEGMETLAPPFANYSAFITAFRTQFEMVDKASNTLTALEQLWQGTKTVQDYIALFKQHAGRMRLSNNDKLIRYRKYLFTFIKDQLAKTNQVHNTFDTIVLVTTNIDKHHRERLVEKAHKAGCSTPTPLYRRICRAVIRLPCSSSNHLLTLMPWTSVLEVLAMRKQGRTRGRPCAANATAAEAMSIPSPRVARASMPFASSARRLITPRPST